MTEEADPWTRLRAATRARIGLGRSGDGLPTAALLDFQLAHARARDAVHGSVDFDAIADALFPLPVLRVRSQARDRSEYLRRPDLGRRLDPSDAASLSPGPWDAVFAIVDGLSAAGVQAHAVATLRATLARLDGWAIGPVVLVRQGRVAIGDPIGAALGATLVAVLIGERPGLTVSDSLGIYLTHDPRPGRLDSERNCLSNVHADGLSPERAADKLAWLMREARHRKLTGVALKEEAPDPALPADRPPAPLIPG